MAAQPSSDRMAGKRAGHVEVARGLLLLRQAPMTIEILITDRDVRYDESAAFFAGLDQWAREQLVAINQSEGIPSTHIRTAKKQENIDTVLDLLMNRNLTILKMAKITQQNKNTIRQYLGDLKKDKRVYSFRVLNQTFYSLTPAELTARKDWKKYLSMSNFKRLLGGRNENI